MELVPAATYPIGINLVGASFYNQSPRHTVEIETFRIVSVSEYEPSTASTRIVGAARPRPIPSRPLVAANPPASRSGADLREWPSGHKNSEFPCPIWICC